MLAKFGQETTFEKAQLLSAVSFTFTMIVNVKLTALRSCWCAGSWPGSTSTQTRRWKMPTKASTICAMAGSSTPGLTRWQSSPSAQAAAQFTDRLAGSCRSGNQGVQQVGDQWLDLGGAVLGSTAQEPETRLAAPAAARRGSCAASGAPVPRSASPPRQQPAGPLLQPSSLGPGPQNPLDFSSKFGAKVQSTLRHQTKT